MTQPSLDDLLTPDLAITWILMASYAYYHLGTTIMSDEFYDHLYRWLHPRLGQVSKVFENRLKLIPDDVGTTSLFMLGEDDYPLRIKRQCHNFLKTRGNSEDYLDLSKITVSPKEPEDDPFAKFF